MENQAGDLVVILPDYRHRMDTLFQSNPSRSSRSAHHIEFPVEYTPLRMTQAHFSNARSVRKAFDRARLGDDVRASRVFG